MVVLGLANLEDPLAAIELNGDAVETEEAFLVLVGFDREGELLLSWCGGRNEDSSTHHVEGVALQLIHLLGTQLRHLHGANHTFANIETLAASQEESLGHLVLVKIN